MTHDALLMRRLRDQRREMELVVRHGGCSCIGIQIPRLHLCVVSVERGTADGLDHGFNVASGAHVPSPGPKLPKLLAPNSSHRLAHSKRSTGIFRWLFVVGVFYCPEQALISLDPPYSLQSRTFPEVSIASLPAFWKSAIGQGLCCQKSSTQIIPNQYTRLEPAQARVAGLW